MFILSRLSVILVSFPLLATPQVRRNPVCSDGHESTVSGTVRDTTLALIRVQL